MTQETGYGTTAEWQDFLADQAERQADATERIARTVEQMSRTVSGIWWILFAWTTVALVGALLLLFYLAS